MIIDLRLTREEAEGLLNVYNTNYAQITQYFPGKEFQLSVLFNAFRSSNVLEEHLRKKEEEEEEYGRDDLLSQISKIIGHDIDDGYDGGAINYTSLKTIYDQDLYYEREDEDNEQELDCIDMHDIMDICSVLEKGINRPLDSFMCFEWQTSWQDFYIENFNITMTHLSTKEQNIVMKELLKHPSIELSFQEDYDGDECYNTVIYCNYRID